MSGPRRYEAVPHPDIKGAWTITPYVNGVRLMIVSKASAEVIAHQRNAALRATEKGKILGNG